MILTLLLLLGSQDAAPATPEVDARPNVVLLYADDLGWRDLAAYGNDFHDTPHLDRLAAEGLRFTDGYANAPNCAPSRACLMTGQVTARHGITTVAPATRGKTEHRKLLVPRTKKALDEGTWTIARALSEAGYRCASMGKWHLSDSPTDFGFEVNVGGNRRGHPKSYFSPYKNPDLPDGPEGEHLTARLTTEALAFLEESQDGPFFLYLTYFAVHTPVQGRKDLVRKYRARKEGDERIPRPEYAAMVDALDQSVGAVLAKLEELELSERTLVLFSSDNGGHGRQTSMGPLRGSKGMLYEGGIRVPWIARWPGRIEAGRTGSAVILGTDLAPTLLELAGLSAPEDHPLDGTSLVPLLDGADALERDAVFWHFPAYLQGYAKGQRWRTTPASAVRIGRHKLHEFFEDGRLELYDLEADPGETRNLAEEQPELRDRLHGRLTAWREEVGAPVPREPNPEYVPD